MENGNTFGISEALTSDSSLTCASVVGISKITIARSTSLATETLAQGEERPKHMLIHNKRSQECQRNLLSGNGGAKSGLFFIREFACAFPGNEWKPAEQGIAGA